MKDVGKGTLTRVLKLVFGAQQIGKASDGWNDFLLGKLIMEADQFRGDGGKYNLNEYIKRETTYPAVLINGVTPRPMRFATSPTGCFTSTMEFPIVAAAQVIDDEKTPCVGDRALLVWEFEFDLLTAACRRCRTADAKSRSISAPFQVPNGVDRMTCPLDMARHGVHNSLASYSEHA
jgi:hypothetical protein